MGAGQEEIAAGLFGLIEGSRGRIRINGRETTIRMPADAIAEGLGLLSRDRRQSLVPMLPIGPNVSLPWLANRSPFSALQHEREHDEAQRYIADLKIRPAMSANPVRFYSGGNQQKIILGALDVEWRIHPGFRRADPRYRCRCQGRCVRAHGRARPAAACRS